MEAEDQHPTTVRWMWWPIGVALLISVVAIIISIVSIVVATSSKELNKNELKDKRESEGPAAPFIYPSR